MIGGERVNGTTKSGRTRVVSIDDETAAVLRQRKKDEAAEQLTRSIPGAAQRTATSSSRLGRTDLPDTVARDVQAQRSP